MEISALASGSSGNCFFIGNDKKSGILIDAGISAKQISERLAIIGKNPEDIKGVFITHEHVDHIRGADVFARQFNIPIYATKKTITHSKICSDESFLNSIKNNETLKIAGLQIEANSKSHKAADPIFFNVCLNKRVSVITDLGYCCKNVARDVSVSDAIFFESNHDIKMLEEGPYPYFLKKWVRGDEGHLSNTQAGVCILEHGSKKLKNIILSHISRTNNTSELALATFRSLMKERKDCQVKVSVSNPQRPTNLIRI